MKFLQAVAEDPRFDSDELLTAIAGITKLSWRQRMQYRFLLIPAARRALKKQRREYDWMYKNPAWGPGRIDPFNPVKFGILKLPVDATIGNSDMVPIWNMKARQGMSLHWDGLSASLREVVLSSALGDGASRKSIPLASLARIEQWLMEVQPPAYPYDVDKALAGEGRVLYDAAVRAVPRGGWQAHGNCRSGRRGRHRSPSPRHVDARRACGLQRGTRKGTRGRSRDSGRPAAT